MSDEPAPTSRVPACMRTGMCCETVLMAFSPKQLRDTYRAWRDGKIEGSGLIHLKDIDIVYPMLQGRCRGKRTTSAGTRYVFGPCKHLAHDTVDGREIASCSIHEDRPQLCRGFPYYSAPQELRNGPHADVMQNPGYMKGCGYNADPGVGLVTADVNAELVPLDDSEK